jgi:hypothetical protein
MSHHPGYDQIPLDPEDPTRGVSGAEQEKRKRVILVSLITFGLVVAAVISLALLKPPYHFAYGVSSSNSYATNIGYDILSRGGNVIDAMVAIQ